MGKMMVPCPLTTRVPRKPYTTSASCGPAFRYSLADMLMRSITARTINPTKIHMEITVGMPNIYPPLHKSVESRIKLCGVAAIHLDSRLLAAYLVPGTHVCNAFLVPRH